MRKLSVDNVVRILLQFVEQGALTAEEAFAIWRACYRVTSMTSLLDYIQEEEDDHS